MSILISAHEVSKAFSHRQLFEGLTFVIESGERVGLIGPNGAGKSTLMKIFAGLLDTDEGTLSCQRGLRIAYLEQSPTFAPEATVESTIQEGSIQLKEEDRFQAVPEILSKLSLDGSRGVHPHTPMAQLSGGWKKRVALARELVKSPDLLLLDEPTNHLDVEGIGWLENLLAQAPFATLTITHDRLFLQRVATRIVELNRRYPDGLLSVAGNFARYLQTQEQMLEAQEKLELKLKNTLRNEIEWLKRGPRARSTKQKARIQRAVHIERELQDLIYRNQSKSVRLMFQAGDKKPKKLLEAKEISKSYNSQSIVRDFNLLLRPGMRVGILGPNGCGKSTLLRLLLDLESPNEGYVTRSKHLAPVYFEQNREALNQKLTLLRTLCPTGDQVIYRGVPLHVRSYLKQFLFAPEQMQMPVSQLSGGEQSRLLIAKLMLQDANLIILDEPTNDLDLPTLEVLENCLKEFAGTVLLVSHDRYFMDQVANQILGFAPWGMEQDGKIESFADFSQWEDWKQEQDKTLLTYLKSQRPKGALQSRPVGKKQKLGYLEQRELDASEGTILEMEKLLEVLRQESHQEEISSDAKKLQELHERIQEMEKEIHDKYERWAELEKKQRELEK